MEVDKEGEMKPLRGFTTRGIRLHRALKLFVSGALLYKDTLGVKMAFYVYRKLSARFIVCFQFIPGLTTVVFLDKQ